MDALIPQVLGLIFALGFTAMIVVLIIALFRPKQLPKVAETFERIVNALLHAFGREEAQKRKNDEDTDPPPA